MAISIYWVAMEAAEEAADAADAAEAAEEDCQYLRWESFEIGRWLGLLWCQTEAEKAKWKTPLTADWLPFVGHVTTQPSNQRQLNWCGY